MNANITDAEHPDSVRGRLCLDFINTVDDRLLSHPQDHLTSYAELTAWSQQAEILSADEGQQLLAAAAAHPAEASAALQASIAFREALYRILVATLADKLPPDDDLATFNAARLQALARSEIAAAREGFVWRWKTDEADLGWMLWPLTRSAAHLLLSPHLKQVKQCSSPDCGWLFLDTSKNHSRRWCTMEGCGNRAKARTHYQRKRQSAQNPS
jgi:predicted RNA-binding Zn ribbon-like protein